LIAANWLAVNCQPIDGDHAGEGESEMWKMSGLKVKQGKDKRTLFVSLPVELRSPIPGGCHCNYCKAHPDQIPTWDTMAVAPDQRHTWTVHYPEIA
jgi:hypothetical protein